MLWDCKMKKIIDLTNKNILITGASQGIGRATAIAASNIGARVLLAARNEEKLNEVLTELNGEGHGVWCVDFSEPEKIELSFDNAVKTFGKLDGMVHCAGISPARPVKMSRYDYMHRVMSVNFYSFAELIRVFIKKKNNNGGGSIVAMSSVSAQKGDKTKGAYAASKAAVEALVRSYAVELAEKNIRLNTVVGGLIKTAMVEAYIRDLGEEAMNTNVLNSQYMGLGEAEDAANAILYLLSDASKFITGTGLVVDGGYLS